MRYESVGKHVDRCYISVFFTSEPEVCGRFCGWRMIGFGCCRNLDCIAWNKKNLPADGSGEINILWMIHFNILVKTPVRLNINDCYLLFSCDAIFCSYIERGYAAL